MTGLRSKLVDQYEQKARLCDRMALEHDSFGPTRHGREYRLSAEHWRGKAHDIRSGAEFRPEGYRA